MDGQERKFLLSLGGTRRILEKYGDKYKFKTIAEFVGKVDVSISVPILLWESLLDRDGLTEDALADIIPMDMTGIAIDLMALLNRSNPERPTTPTLETEPETKLN